MALYDDIGGAPVIRRVLNAFYPRVLADSALGPFFLGVDIERLKKTQEEFLAMVLGGPNHYTGRGLHEAHKRTRLLGANTDVFERYLTVFKGVLVDFGLPDRTVAEWLAVFEGARGHILNR